MHVYEQQLSETTRDVYSELPRKEYCSGVICYEVRLKSNVQKNFVVGTLVAVQMEKDRVEGY